MNDRKQMTFTSKQNVERQNFEVIN